MRRFSMAATLAIGLILAIASAGPRRRRAGPGRTPGGPGQSRDPGRGPGPAGPRRGDGDRPGRPASRPRRGPSGSGARRSACSTSSWPKNPTVAPAPLIRFQAGVYRWAEGRSLAEQAELVAGRRPGPAGAVRALDDAVAPAPGGRAQAGRRRRAARRRTSGSGWPRRSPTGPGSSPRTTRPGWPPSARRWRCSTPR